MCTEGGGLLSHRLVFFLNGTITSKQNAFSFQKPVWGSKEFRSFVFMPTDYPWATVRAVRLVLWCESSSEMIWRSQWGKVKIEVESDWVTGAGVGLEAGHRARQAAWPRRDPESHWGWDKKSLVQQDVWFPRGKASLSSCAALTATLLTGHVFLLFKPFPS